MGKTENRENTCSLAERLVALRKKQGYSQQEIADRLSVTRQTISNWECGQGAPALDKAAELAAIYQISLDELAGLADEREAPGVDLHILKKLEGRRCQLEFTEEKTMPMSGSWKWEIAGSGSNMREEKKMLCFKKRWWCGK